MLPDDVRCGTLAPAGRDPVSEPTRLRALATRLSLVTAALQPVAEGGQHPHPGVDGSRAAVLEGLERLVRHLQSEVDRADAWLVLVGVEGSFPDPAAVERLRRRLRLDPAAEVAADLLAVVLAAPARASEVDLVLVSDRPVVDVDFTARNDLQTGIQRVVRQTVSRWSRREVLTLAVWDDAGTAMRELTTLEHDRVVSFRPGTHASARPALSRVVAGSRTRMVVPWRTTVVLPEVPRAAVGDRLRALAQANRLVTVGHDCIPVVSAETLPADEAVKFVRYLSVLKHARLVVGVSEASAREFSGFAAMLHSQGLHGPDVAACPLPVEVPVSLAPVASAADARGPQVLVVGSHEPRKNHLAVLHAAERLWQEGLRFRLVFVGGRGWRAEVFDAQVRVLARRGRAVRTARGVGDDELWALYRQSRFSVFPSLHEGFGLPVAESLATGVPVLTSDRGSTAEIARGGGALTVDPLDDEALVVAMRRLLTEDTLHAALVAGATARAPRSWDDYAEELWSHVAEVAR